MAKPSENFPTNSAEGRGLYRSPRRESIDDHLAIARKRLAIPYGTWTDKTARVDWVLDLHKKQIVNGPADADKLEGPGRGKRYKPGDYRDLLTVIRLKARGVGRRSAWVAHLWLRGHGYPIERFRASLLKEIRAMRKDVIADFAPRGLSRRMDFRAQYARYMAKRAEQGKETESALFSYLAAWGMAPDRINEIEPDTAAIAAEVNEAVGSEVHGLEGALGEVFAAMSSGAELSPETGTVLMDLVGRTPFAGIFATLAEDENLRKEIEDLPKRLRGTVDDGRAGRDTSSLISTVKKASEADFVRARRWHRGIRSGDLERILRAAIPHVPPEFTALLEGQLATTRFQREVMHVNPVLALHIYACVLQSDVPIELLDAKEQAAYRDVMNALRNQ